MTERKFSIYYSPCHTRDVEDGDSIRRAWQDKTGTRMIASLEGSTLSGIRLTITDTGSLLAVKGQKIA